MEEQQVPQAEKGKGQRSSGEKEKAISTYGYHEERGPGVALKSNTLNRPALQRGQAPERWLEPTAQPEGCPQRGTDRNTRGPSQARPAVWKVSTKGCPVTAGFFSPRSQKTFQHTPAPGERGTPSQRGNG